MRFMGIIALTATCLLFCTVLSADRDTLRLPSTADTLHSEDGLVDTLGRERVIYVPHAGDGVAGLSVPLVDTDTSTYDKRLWLSEKKAISGPFDDPWKAVVAAVDSSVYVAFADISGGEWHLYTTQSVNYGIDWTDPMGIQELGCCNGGQPHLFVHDSLIYLAYTQTAWGWWYLLIRKATVGQEVWSDPVLIDSVSEDGGGVTYPVLGSVGDTLFVSYRREVGEYQSVAFQFTVDRGETWQSTGGGVEDGGGTTFVVVDSVFLEVYQAEVNIMGSQSTDRGASWTAGFPIAADDGYASQDPAAATDGLSAAHVVWFDYEGKDDPSCEGGYPYYRRSLDYCESWEPIRSLSDFACSDDADIFADSTRVYTTWSDDRTGSPDYSVYLRYSHDRGDTWSPEIQIVDEADPAWQSDIYAWHDYVYIIWREQHPPDWIWQTMYIFGAWYTPGDIDMSGSIDIADLVYMAMYMFQEGPQPWVMGAVEMDGAEGINIADLVYLVMYMFQEGPPPVGAPEP